MGLDDVQAFLGRPRAPETDAALLAALEHSADWRRIGVQPCARLGVADGVRVVGDQAYAVRPHAVGPDDDCAAVAAIELRLVYGA